MPSVLRLSASGITALIALAAALTAVPRARAQQTTGRAAAVFTLDSGNITGGLAMSPDRRWVVYGQAESNTENQLYVRSTTGGPSVQLTSGRAVNVAPTFTPSGDRIVYLSTFPAPPTGAAVRSDDQPKFLVALPFDTRTGRAAGPPRQVSLDAVGFTNEALAISPDGRWIAYRTCCDTVRLRVIPSTGGTARTLVSSFAGWNLAFAEDGRSVFYVMADPVLGPMRGRRLMRVALDGGAPVEVRRYVLREGDRSVRIGPGRLTPGARFGAGTERYGAEGRQRRLVVVDERSDSIVQETPLPDGFDPERSAWTPDGRTYVGAVADDRSVIRLVSTAGGPPRQLSVTDVDSWPLGWSADGRMLYYTMMQGGRQVMAAVSLDGVQGPRVEMPGSAVSIIGRYAVGTARGRDSLVGRLVVRNLDDGRVTTYPGAPAPAAWEQPAAADTDAYAYVAQVGDRVEVRRLAFGQAPRTLEVFPASRPHRVAVHGGRVAYLDAVGDSVRLMLGTGGPPRRLAAVPSKATGRTTLAWSRDGRRLVFAGRSDSVLYVLDLAPDGTPEGAPRRVPLPFAWAYDHTFLPDNRGIAMIAQPRGAPYSVVAVLSVDDPSHPRLLSEADGLSAWDFWLSPDGRWIAYEEDLPPKKTTVYRVDVGDVGGRRTAHR